jgi:hypothetical protein
MIAKTESVCSRQARLTFAMCRHTVVDLAQVFAAVPRAPGADRLPASELERMHSLLAKAGFPVVDSPATTQKLTDLRAMYEPYLNALSNHLYMEVPPWILAKEITDNWKTSAWGRITGFSNLSDGSPDDHSS